ncbi:nucleotidyltransferase family protein [Bacteroidota bacterium]
MIREAIILAGGLGTRIRSEIGDLPKALASINGRPFMEYQLDYLYNWQVKKVIIATGYGSDLIQSHFGNKYKELELVYSIEEEPLGTGGAIKKAMDLVDGLRSIVVNGDTYYEVDIYKMIDFQRIKESNLLLNLSYEEDVSRYGAVEINKLNRIVGFHEKGEKKDAGYINGGFYFLNKAFFLSFDLPDKFSFEKDFLEKYYKEYFIHGVRCSAYFIDIGIPEDYKRAQHEFKEFNI